MEAIPGLQRDRDSCLRPILEQLHALLRNASQQEGGTWITIGQQRVEISPWERATALETLGNAKSREPWRVRVVECLGLVARALGDIHRLETTGPVTGEREVCRADLVFDLALGLALKREMQVSIDDALRESRRALAKNLADLQQRLTQVLNTLRRMVDPGDVDHAVRLSEQLRSEDTGMRRTAGRIVGSLFGARGRPAGKGGYGRKQLVLAGAATVLMVCAVFYGVRSASGVRDLEARLQSIQGIESHAGAPPAMNVVVSAETWRALDGPARQRFVLAVGAAIRADGYKSAEIRLRDGSPAAEWKQGERVRVY